MPQYPANIDLSSLDGSNGFRLNGVTPGDSTGTAVSSAGDVNGDGFDDVIVGAQFAEPNGNASGASYVVFGKAFGFDANINLSSLDGSNGFTLNGAGQIASAGDAVGTSVASAGDVNGDGVDDLIVGGRFGSPHGFASGTSYVVFGTTTGFNADIELSSLDGINGFKLSGVEEGDESGKSVASAGDVNGDGFGDLIVGAANADPHGYHSGASYVVFGKATGFGTNVDLSSLDGSNGFKISGEAARDYSGWSVASAGDVNGDGFADLIVGAFAADANGPNSGASYVVFGKAGGFSSNIDLSTLDGSNGFRLPGVAQFDSSGTSVASAGDINGDGFDDLVIGAKFADPHGGYSGASYVVFGKATGFSSNFDLSSLNGRNGFKLSGAAAGDYSGASVASAGDVNGDGFDDLIVGAPSADPNGTSSGATYVVFGKHSGFDANIDLSSLDGTNGFRLSGVAGDGSGVSVASAGDINGDGIADLVVGAPGNAGGSYVVFGLQPTTAVVRVGTDASQTLAGGAFDDELKGRGGDDKLYGNGGNDTLVGDDGSDTLHGGAGDDDMRGGAGDDTYYADSAGDLVKEGDLQGADTVHTTVSYTLAPNVEILIADSGAGLTLIGNSHDNTITGGGGADHINGGLGADQMSGGAGDDIFNVEDMGDAVTDGAGFDTVITKIDYTLGSDIEQLLAGSDNGLILTGNDHDNRIVGGAGNDVLTGGLGKDTLRGGAGDDVFKYLAAGDSSPAGAARDKITDFDTGDKTDLSAIDAIDGGGHDTFAFIGGDNFTAAGQVRFTTTAGGDTLIEANTGGTLSADFAILLRDAHALSAADFKFT